MTLLLTLLSFPSIVGDINKEEKVALTLVCRWLSKKGIEKPLTYLYEECKVSQCS